MLEPLVVKVTRAVPRRVRRSNPLILSDSMKDTRKVKRLQRLLLQGKAVLLLAIRRVTQTNKGKNTPGIDGFRAINDVQRGTLFDTLKTKKIQLHRPKPAYRKYIRKKNGKLRSLGIPTIVDRIYQEIVRMALEPQFEVNFEPTSYGFRPKRGCHDALRRILYNIRGGQWSWVFEGDFKSCFDTLDHDFILGKIKGFPLHNLVAKFLKAGYVDNNIFHNTNEGTPQGGLLSPLLANIALDGMEEVLKISYKEIYSRGNTHFRTKGKYRMVRYADDFVIFAKSREDIEAIPDILKPYLEDRSLELAEDKTRIIHISDGFDFLGFNFRRYKNKDGFIHLCKPSKSSIRQFKSKISEICYQMRGHNADELIKRLNSLIIGTANYWKASSAKKTFSNMDYYLWNITFKFLQKLHKNKGKSWIKNKYYPTYYDGRHSGNWVLTGLKENNHLIKMAWTPIKYHTMIQHNNSPYDSSKSEYFINRYQSC
jgi:RNA-directed DNA polymerase